MATAAYILITLAFLIAGYMYGDISASREWKKLYVELYKTAIAEIHAARSGAGMDSKELLTKLSDLRDPKIKRPSLKVIKLDSDK